MSQETKITLRKKRITVALYKVLMLTTIIIMVISIVLFFLEEDKGLEKIIGEILLCAGAMICFSIPIFLEKKFKMFIPNYILVLLFLFIFAHFIIGEIYRVYDYSMIFDKILHTISGIIVAMLSYSIVSILNEYPKNKIKLSPLFLSIFVFCFTMTMEYLWEIFEYLVDTLTNSNMQRWQDSLYNKSFIPDVKAAGEYIHTNARGNGLNDTMMDMIVNIIGALAVSIYGYIGLKINPESWILDKVILTDGNISAMKKTNPHFLIDRELPVRQKNSGLILRQVKNVQKRYMIVSQKAKRIYLRDIDEQRSRLMKKMVVNKSNDALRKGFKTTFK